MSKDSSLPQHSGGDSSSMIIPGFKGSSPMVLDVSKTREAESRLIEAKTVNPITYTDLEHCFSEAYRELKRHHSTLGYQLALAEKAMEQAKAVVLLDKYPTFMEGKPKSHDNADLRKAFLMQDADYLEALDRFNMLKALESFVDGRIKVLENVSRYMKKEMDIIIRSGLTDKGLYKK